MMRGFTSHHVVPSSDETEGRLSRADLRDPKELLSVYRRPDGRRLEWTEPEAATTTTPPANRSSANGQGQIDQRE
jgi:hypothetical protein